MSGIQLKEHQVAQKASFRKWVGFPARSSMPPEGARDTALGPRSRRTPSAAPWPIPGAAAQSCGKSYGRRPSTSVNTVWAITMKPTHTAMTTPRKASTQPVPAASFPRAGACAVACSGLSAR
ncbi:hypothetical protein SHIRM173S_06320 [Streptomyces hirsutus]